MIVRNKPVPATNLGSAELGRAVRIYQRKTRANRGPVHMHQTCITVDIYDVGTGGDRNKQLEDRTLRITVTNSCRY